jgi:segregation and condensation protein A
MSEAIDPRTKEELEEEPQYHVRLEVFEGPLDLLLHLIERQELDITKVSLVAVTDQYLAYIQRLDRISADNLADFLVVAAKLLLIKSRALLPAPPPEAEGEEEDLGEELARQLREYKRLKVLAQHLREREEQGLEAYVRVAPLPQVEKELDLSDVTLDDLLAAVREALTVVPPAPEVNGVVAPVTITIAEKIEQLSSWIAERRSFSFNRVLRAAASRIEIIITFLALLQMIRRGSARVQQDRLFGEILVSAPEEAPPATGPQQPPQQ